MKKRMNKIILVLLILSLVVNVYLLGKWFLLDQWYVPTEEEKIILSEMVQKTVQSEEYQRIADREKIIAIDTSVDKNKGGVFPYYFDVSVRTDKETYIFSCIDEKCSDVSNEGWTYSIYEDESPRLPLNEE